MKSLTEGVYPANLDKDAFEQVRHRLAFNKQASIRNEKHPQDLGLLPAGFIYCSIFGSLLTVNQHNPTSTNARRKHECVCQTCTGKRELVVNHFTFISVHIMDQAAWTKALEVIADHSQVRMRVEALREANHPQIDTESITATIIVLKLQLHNLYTLAQAATDDETIESIK